MGENRGFTLIIKYHLRNRPNFAAVEEAAAEVGIYLDCIKL
jgi:hypothetical protein